MRNKVANPNSVTFGFQVSEPKTMHELNGLQTYKYQRLIKDLQERRRCLMVLV